MGLMNKFVCFLRPSGNCLGIFELAGLKAWHAKTVSVNQDLSCYSPYSVQPLHLQKEREPCAKTHSENGVGILAVRDLA